MTCGAGSVCKTLERSLAKLVACSSVVLVACWVRRLLNGLLSTLADGLRHHDVGGESFPPDFRNGHGSFRRWVDTLAMSDRRHAIAVSFSECLGLSLVRAILPARFGIFRPHAFC